jgi:hypothetical protein
LNILQEIGFTKEEIQEKKIDDIKKLDWDRFGVEFLIQFFTKKEIVKRKKVFGNYKGHGHYNQVQKTDLEFFTKEEIERWKLLDKTILKFSDLKAYSKEEIVKRKLIQRVDYMQLYQLADLGFSYKEIQTFSKTSKFESDPMSEKINGKSRAQVIKLISDRFNNREDSDKMQLCYIANLTPDDFSFDRLMDLFSSSFFKNCESSIKFFAKIYGEDDKMIRTLIRKNEGKYLMTLSSLIKKDFCKNISLNLISEWLKLEVSSYSRIDVFVQYEMEHIRENLLEYPELYDEIYTKIQSYILRGSYYSLKINSGSRDRDLDVDSTIRNLDFWQLGSRLSLDNIKSIFSHIGLSKAKSVTDYCIKNNISLEGKGHDFIRSIGNYHDTVDNLEFCIQNSIDVVQIQ